MKKPAWRKKLEGRAGEWLIRKLQRKLLRQSPEAAEKYGAKLGRRLFRVAKSRRERALSNLRLAFPELSESERTSIAQKCLEHFGMITADFLQIPKRSQEYLQSTTEVVGVEHVKTALAQGKGVLAVTGHFGNWERLSTYLSLDGITMNVVARDADDQGVQGLVKEMRSFTGTKVLSRGNAAREIMRALKRGELVGLLPDQNADEVFIPFFGQPAGTVLGPGVMHKRTGAPVIPVVCTRIGPGRYRTVVFPPLEPVPGYEIEEGIMRAFNDFLEREIRKAPEQYLWFHDRWRNARKRGLIT